jgi:hypothetical protein
MPPVCLIGPIILLKLGYFIAKVELAAEALGYDTKLRLQL